MTSLNPSKLSFLEKLVTCDNDDEDPTSTPLHDCLLGNDNNSLSVALALCPSDVNRLDYLGWSPMHLAIWRGDKAALSMMLACPDSNLQVRSSDGDSLLHVAVRLEEGSMEMTRLLLEAGADVNARIDIRSYYGRTPIIFAFHNPETLQLLLERDAEHTIEVEYNDSVRCLENPVTYASNRNFDFEDGADRQHRWDKSLGLLVSYGIDLDLPDSFGLTPLLWVIVNRNGALLRLLIQYGARIDPVDEDGWGILHFAARFGDLELINILSDAKIKGIQPDAKSTDGESPMLIMVGRLLELEFNGDGPPGITVPTYEEMLAFKQLLDDIHYRNMNGQPASGGTSVDPKKRVDDVDETDVEGNSVTSDQSFESTLALFGSVTSHGDWSTDSNQHDEPGDSENSEDESADEEFFDADESLDVASSSR